MSALHVVNFLASESGHLDVEFLRARLTHTGRIPFELASFIIKRRFLCKLDYCEGRENSSFQVGEPT
jgi:hypothetical protein